LLSEDMVAEVFFRIFVLQFVPVLMAIILDEISSA